MTWAGQRAASWSTIHDYFAACWPRLALERFDLVVEPPALGTAAIFELVSEFGSADESSWEILYAARPSSRGGKQVAAIRQRRLIKDLNLEPLGHLHNATARSAIASERCVSPKPSSG
jgi:hypothetical protein